MGNFSEYLQDLIVKLGSQANVASASDIDPTKLSRFRSDQSGLMRAEVDKLLAIGGAVIALNKDIVKYEDTIDLMTTLWKRERDNGKSEGR